MPIPKIPISPALFPKGRNGEKNDIAVILFTS
jgi:hypothetical protein